MKEKLIISLQLPLFHPFSLSPPDVNFVEFIFSYLFPRSNKSKHTHTDTYTDISHMLDFINHNCVPHKWDHSVYTRIFKFPFSSHSSRAIDINQSYLKLTTGYS